MLGETRKLCCATDCIHYGPTRRHGGQTPFRKYLLWGVEPEYMAAALGAASSWWRLSCRPGTLAWIGSLARFEVAK